MISVAPRTIRASESPRTVRGSRVAHGWRAAQVVTAEPELDERTDESVEEDRPWVVIVWTDPFNLMSYVRFVLQKLFGFSG
ncbi:MAG: ATP-dependent Clp protease adaptor ClpS, partial [Actinomycetota bacterium]